MDVPVNVIPGILTVKGTESVTENGSVIETVEVQTSVPAMPGTTVGMTGSGILMVVGPLPMTDTTNPDPIPVAQAPLRAIGILGPILRFPRPSALWMIAAHLPPMLMDHALWPATTVLVTSVLVFRSSSLSSLGYPVRQEMNGLWTQDLGDLHLKTDLSLDARMTVTLGIVSLDHPLMTDVLYPPQLTID